MELQPLKEDIASAEKYIIQEGIITFIKLMQKDLDGFEQIISLKKYDLGNAKFHDLTQLYVINYQTKACYSLIKKHGLNIGNYLFDLGDVKTRISKVRKRFKEDFNRILGERNGDKLVGEFKIFYK